MLNEKTSTRITLYVMLYINVILFIMNLLSASRYCFIQKLHFLIFGIFITTLMIEVGIFIIDISKTTAENNRLLRDIKNKIDN